MNRFLTNHPNYDLFADDDDEYACDLSDKMNSKTHNDMIHIMSVAENFARLKCVHKYISAKNAEEM